MSLGGTSRRGFLMIKMMKIEKGFTLIEILAVIVILGLLATLIIPRYAAQVERGYVAEATEMLSAIRQTEAAYFLENSSTYTSTLSALDVDTSPSTKFTYTASASSGLATATRNGGGSAWSGQTITLSFTAGTWGGTHTFKPT
jgi:prepilin-type N-terminal cleavage/methylation domain-containing protein